MRISSITSLMKWTRSFMCATRFRTELVYLNDFGKKTSLSRLMPGKKCFEVLHKQSEPCPFCKNEHLTINDFIVWELPVENDHHYLIRDKLISWDNRLLKMGIANDIIHQELTSQNVARNCKMNRFC